MISQTGSSRQSFVWIPWRIVAWMSSHRVSCPSTRFFLPSEFVEAPVVTPRHAPFFPIHHPLPPTEMAPSVRGTNAKRHSLLASAVQSHKHRSIVLTTSGEMVLVEMMIHARWIVQGVTEPSVDLGPVFPWEAVTYNTKVPLDRAVLYARRANENVYPLANFEGTL